MNVHTINKKTFELCSDGRQAEGRLMYSSDAFNNGIIEASQLYELTRIATGVWTTSEKYNKDSKKTISSMRVETGGIISLKLTAKKTTYQFKKSAGWKLRFLLRNKDGEDLLSIIPIVNWQKESHDFVLQVNEEFESECSPFLILQALHCANCSLSMMTGGSVPALVSI
ncbi:MAG TPA: hypothetical protein PLZ68_16505 [Ferruginibacter sp.]|nr:hypothetical protein [Ferruginibacter sp.]